MLLRTISLTAHSLLLLGHSVCTAAAVRSLVLFLSWEQQEQDHQDAAGGTKHEQTFFIFDKVPSFPLKCSEISIGIGSFLKHVKLF